MRIVSLFLLVLFLGSVALAQIPYPGFETPPAQPRLFAPDLINNGLLTRDLAMTPDGSEIYFCQVTAGYRQGVILVTRWDGQAWAAPVVAPFSGDPRWVDLEPCITPDGQQLFFYSSRPAVPGGEPAQDLWVVARQGEGWGSPRNLGAPINTEAPEFFPSVTADGTVYFCRADPATGVHTLYRARTAGQGYAEPERLPDQANAGTNRFNAYVAPDESRMIIPVAGHPDNRGTVDYWLALRSPDDIWRGPFNLGPLINDGSGSAWSPYVSPDGQAFFFMSGRTQGVDPSWPESWLGLQGRHFSPGSGRAAIYWVAADFLDQLEAGQTPPDPATQAQEVIGPDRGRVGWMHRGGPYLGQDPPGTEPVIFAPGQVSTGLNERDIVISPDGRTIYFGVMDLGLVTVMVTHDLGNRWSVPVTAPFHLEKEFACFEPTLGSDGQEVFFLSNRAAPGQTQGRGWANQNIFHSRLENGLWSVPAALPTPVTTEAAEYFPSVTRDGTLYFSREDADGHPFLWRAAPEVDGFATPVRLPDSVNIGSSCYNAFVAPDESFLIACVAGHEDNLGPADYWISVRDAEGHWQPARNLGQKFNGPDSRASSAFLSPDGKYLFFSAARINESLPARLTRQDLLRLHGSPGNGASDIWWVAASVLDPFLPSKSD